MFILVILDVFAEALVMDCASGGNADSNDDHDCKSNHQCSISIFCVDNIDFFFYAQKGSGKGY